MPLSIPPAPLVPSWRDYFRMRPGVFRLWFHLRRFKFYIQRKLGVPSARWRQMNLDSINEKADKADVVIGYSKSMILNINRDRLERLINILRCIRGLNILGSKVLCIGPRNEAEVLLMSLYGFARGNITAIDLFSYSPLIDVMDMHDLKYPDNHFDITCLAYCVNYSSDVPRVCREVLRVTKDSGLIVVGFPFQQQDHPASNGQLSGWQAELTKIGTALSGGLKEFFGHFGDQIQHVYWQEEYPAGPNETIASAIFRVDKAAAKPSAREGSPT